MGRGRSRVSSHGASPKGLRDQERRHYGSSLPRPRPQIPARRFHHPDRPGSDGAHPAQRHRDGPHRACLHADRRARRRQDHDRPHHRPGAQLRRARRQGRRDNRSLRRLRQLQGHHRRPPCRRDRDGRRLAHRRRRCPRADRGRALPPGLGTLQGLHHRRSAHAVGEGVQRAAEDAGRAAAAREVPVRHHRDPQGSGDGAVAAASASISSVCRRRR